VISAEYRLKETGRFELARIAHPASESLWEAHVQWGACPIQIRTSAGAYDCNTQYRLISQSNRAVGRGGQRQTIVLQDRAATARFVVIAELYPNQPVLRQSITFRNLRDAAVEVTEADMFSAHFEDGNHNFTALRVNQWSNGGAGGNFELSEQLLLSGEEFGAFSGSAGLQCSWLALQRPDQRGLFIGWEFNGRAYGKAEHDVPTNRIAISVPIMQLGSPVAPNASFQVPAAFVGLFHGDWDEAAYRTHRFVEQVLAKPVRDPNFPFVIWDSWRYEQSIDEATMRREAQLAASLGIEVFVLDLGWAKRIGDWQGDPKKFPSGIRAFADYVHSLGMKFGLHYAFTEADAASPVLQQNPDWTSSWNENYYGAQSLCLAHEPVREWLEKETLRMIDEYNVDWILTDGENPIKRCSKTTHTHDENDSNYKGAIAGLEALLAALQTARPNVYWENCQDGGNMMTYAMVRRYHTSIVADNSGAMITRQAVHGVTYPFPIRFTDRYMPDEVLDLYTTRSFMFGGPWIFMNRLAAMKQPDLTVAANEIRLYKQLRRRILTGRVYHLTDRPREGAIDAMQSLDEATGSAIAFVWRAGARDSEYRLRPRGLNKDAAYTVRFQDSGQTSTMTGLELMSAGVPVRFSKAYDAHIVYLDIKSH